MIADDSCPPARATVSLAIAGSGLATPNVSAPQIAADRSAQVQLVEQAASTATPACWCTPRSWQPRRRPDSSSAASRLLERPRGIGDVGGVKVDEILQQAIDFGDAHRPPVHLEPALEQLAGAGADHVARGLQRHRRHAFTLEHVLERAAIRSGALSTSVPSRSNTIMREEVIGNSLSVGAASCK